jgi:hypothetical protein
MGATAHVLHLIVVLVVGHILPVSLERSPDHRLRRLEERKDAKLRTEDVADDLEHADDDVVAPRRGCRACGLLAVALSVPALDANHAGGVGEVNRAGRPVRRAGNALLVGWYV